MIHNIHYITSILKFVIVC